MPDLFGDTLSITLREQVAEVERELRMRERNYPGFITRGLLSAVRAERQVLVLRAVLDTLQGLDRAGGKTQ